MDFSTMTVAELAAWIALGLGALATVIQIAPIKIDPWSWLASTIGKALNRDVLVSLEEVKAAQRNNERKLDEHIKADDEREADGWRASILHFNLELIRGIHHTREDFIEIFLVIDKYETYCRLHEDYSNNRAVHAIANIGRVYDERQQKNDFEKE